MQNLIALVEVAGMRKLPCLLCRVHLQGTCGTTLKVKSFRTKNCTFYRSNMPEDWSKFSWKVQQVREEITFFLGHFQPRFLINFPPHFHALPHKGLQIFTQWQLIENCVYVEMFGTDGFSL